MKTARIADFGSHVGEEVLVRGWLHNKRSSGKLQFLIVQVYQNLLLWCIYHTGAARHINRHQ